MPTNKNRIIENPDFVKVFATIEKMQTEYYADSFFIIKRPMPIFNVALLRSVEMAVSPSNNRFSGNGKVPKLSGDVAVL